MRPFDPLSPSRWQASIRAHLTDHRALVQKSVHAPLPLTCSLGEPELNPSVWAKEVPEELLGEIRKAGSILVVGDVDADGVGSAVGLARALAALGKHAVAYASTPPTLDVQKLLEPNEVRTGDLPERFDLVVHVDQDGSRVGPAVKEAMERAGKTVVIDHHDVTADRSTLSWIDTGADAAALMTLGLIIRLTENADLPTETWKQILTPILAAIESDTHGLAEENTRPSTYGIVRYLLRHTGADIRAVMEMIDPFSPELKKLACEMIETRIEGEPPRRTGLVKVDSTAFEKLFDALRAEADGGVEEDAYHLVITAVQIQIEAHDLDLSVALIERPDHIKVSTRSRAPEDALILARAFGGNGKPGEGGSAIRGERRSIETEHDRAMRLLDNWRTNDLERVVMRWRMGSI